MYLSRLRKGAATVVVGGIFAARFGGRQATPEISRAPHAGVGFKTESILTGRPKSGVPPGRTNLFGRTTSHFVAGLYPLSLRGHFTFTHFNRQGSETVIHVFTFSFRKLRLRSPPLRAPPRFGEEGEKGFARPGKMVRGGSWVNVRVLRGNPTLNPD